MRQMSDPKKLKEVLELYGIRSPDDTIGIMYRTYDPDGEDVFTGYCRFINGELFATDGGVYSLEDELVDWDIRPSSDGNEYLNVWYESEWNL